MMLLLLICMRGMRCPLLPELLVACVNNLLMCDRFIVPVRITAVPTEDREGWRRRGEDKE